MVNYFYVVFKKYSTKEDIIKIIDQRDRIMFYNTKIFKIDQLKKEKKLS